VAAGVYSYVNHENSDYYVFNTDLRFACVYPYLYLDVAGGIGAPLKNDYNGDEVIVLIDTLYAHGGLNLLVGNNYTPVSLFLQAGVYDIPLKRGGTGLSIDPDKVYLLLEPRFQMPSLQLRFTLFSLPPGTVENLLFIHDTLGFNMLAYTDSLYAGNGAFSFGINTTFSFSDANYEMFFNPLNFTLSTLNVSLSPYTSMQLFSGEIHIMAQMSLTDIVRASYASAFRLNVGYRTQL